MKLKLKKLRSSSIEIYLVFCLILTLLNYVLCVETEADEKYYLITFEFKSEDEEEVDITSENNNNSLSFIDNQMINILKLMLNNKETYDNTEIIDQYSSVKEKRDGNNDSFEDIIKSIKQNTSSLIDIIYEDEERGFYTIYALLSKELYLIVKKMPYVTQCIEDFMMDEFEPEPEPNINTSYEDLEEIYDEEEENDIINDDYYNLLNIKNETHWSNVTVYNNSFHHLSLLSQGKFESSIINKYDTNYYYPDSAGEGVNVVIIDSGFMFDHEDFDVNNRIVRCQAICIGSYCTDVHDDPTLSKYCTSNPSTHFFPSHGTRVASVAAGKIYGVAKKANIFGISVDTTQRSFIAALLYVFDRKDSLFKPSKTIINISSGSYIYNSSYEQILNSLNKEGFMVITSGGNDKIDSCIKTEREYIRNKEIKTAHDLHYPSSYSDVIGVGSINNNFSDLYIKNSLNLYSKASYSNYGSCIDFWAPGYVYAALPSDENVINLNIPDYCNEFNENILTKTDYEKSGDEKVKESLCSDQNNFFMRIKKTAVENKWSAGTSFSSPIVAGVSALIVSENKDTIFNQVKLRKKLNELSLKNVINFDETTQHSNNIFINNGKRVTYSRDNTYPENYCGSNVGNSVCSDNKCCYSNGICGTSSSLCEITNGWQTEFGYCIGLQSKVSETVTLTTTTTTRSPTTTIVKTTTKTTTTTTVLKTTPKTTTTTVLKTTPKTTTTTVVKTTQITSNKPTRTTSVMSTSTSLPLIYIITLYNENYYVGEEKSSKPYDLRISRNKTKLYSNIKTPKVWGEIKNASGRCLGNINKNYCKTYGINESSLEKDYLVYLPCEDSNVLMFYQYTISTGDTIVKIGYKNGKPFKGYYEDSNHYRCNGTDNCCFYLDNDSIIAANCDAYYSSDGERKYFRYKITS